eukprot:GGOE01029857.1.p2 GENE.GGOE01029857.1~~GGOE01029857.1.p2  ORF type:complete len:143 (-),score=4.04 GGOE01029857.1:728-1156(-)
MDAMESMAQGDSVSVELSSNLPPTPRSLWPLTGGRKPPLPLRRWGARQLFFFAPGACHCQIAGMCDMHASRGECTDPLSPHGTLWNTPHSSTLVKCSSSCTSAHILRNPKLVDLVPPMGSVPHDICDTSWMSRMSPSIHLQG